MHFQRGVVCGRGSSRARRGRGLTAVAVALWLGAGPVHAQPSSDGDEDTEEPRPEEPGPEEEPLRGSFELTPRGVISVNAAWSDRPLTPGAFGYYVANPVFDVAQFELSAVNSVFGFKIEGVSFRNWKLEGATDVSLKSPEPERRTELAPLFYDVHIGARAENAYVVIGKFPDVVSAMEPSTLNGFPGSNLPGMLGFYRPQVRTGTRIDLARSLDIRLHGSIGRHVQNFRITPLTIGGGGGVPDLQGRISVGAGEWTPEPLRPWKRRYAVGVAAHIGRRRFGLVENDLPTVIVAHETWSFGVDFRAELPTGTSIRGHLWKGRVVGDYGGAILQSVSPETLAPISATGGWFDIRQHLGEAWSIAAGYGRDDPEDGPLSMGQRALNQMAFTQVHWQWSRVISSAAEASYWNTDWVGLGDVDTWRGEINTAVKF